MALNYYPETDPLYNDLSEKASVESREISQGVVLGYDAEGNLVGIDTIMPEKGPIERVESQEAAGRYLLSSMR